jgi:hypothetical protein
MRNEPIDILRFHDVTITADREYKAGMGNCVARQWARPKRRPDEAALQISARE